MINSTASIVGAARTRYGVEHWFQIDYTDDDFTTLDQILHAGEPSKGLFEDGLSAASA